MAVALLKARENAGYIDLGLKRMGHPSIVINYYIIMLFFKLKKIPLAVILETYEYNYC